MSSQEPPVAAIALHPPESLTTSKSFYASITADIVAAACTAAATSPVVAVIDRSIIANFSGRQSLVSGLLEGFGTLLTRPWIHFRQPSVLAVFTVYSLTYAATNTTETIAKRSKMNPSLPKFVASSTTNTLLTVWKDSLLTRWFGQGIPRAVPGGSYACFAFRDSLTMAAAFTFPPIVSGALQGAGASKGTADVTCQLMLPCLFQFVTTPVHLYGLDLYNRPDASSLSDRLRAVRKEYLPSTFARMGRILPAFGFGGVINSKVRASTVEYLK